MRKDFWAMAGRVFEMVVALELFYLTHTLFSYFVQGLLSAYGG